MTRRLALVRLLLAAVSGASVFSTTTSIAGASEVGLRLGQPSTVIGPTDHTEVLGRRCATLGNGKPISLDVASVARGSDFTGTWIDFKHQLIHSADSTVSINPP